MTTYEDVEKAHIVWFELDQQTKAAKATLDKAIAAYNETNADDPIDEIDRLLINIDLTTLD